MTPCEALAMMRARGYDVALRRGRVLVHAPAAGLTDERRQRAVEWLRDHHAELGELLHVELSPAVQSAISLLGAQLGDVRHGGPEHCSHCQCGSRVLVRFGDGALCPRCFK